MSKRITLAELRELLQAARERAASMVAELNGNHNPCVATAFASAVARRDTYFAVIRALEGDCVSLRIDAGK